MKLSLPVILATITAALSIANAFTAPKVSSSLSSKSRTALKNQNGRGENNTDSSSLARRPATTLSTTTFSQLGTEIDTVLPILLGEADDETDEADDAVHLEMMMDTTQYYVPNVTIGPMVCQALREHGLTTPIDVHLRRSSGGSSTTTVVNHRSTLMGDLIDAGVSHIIFSF
mmetsp:Transcript_6158/g.7067  ORF Transcript_6158/g.7067 Transcript_6158/m.7067 type:complete len:172 (-) Transcript_6158:392-907(-)|eukprot:CAMPEP_0170861402 /NCGR_PEP_ID=MMETSP0734-20130129/18186_1 /TAXON_ID=186038 /ORGANISM="Fragilariopsis kerguelensis, Strain L26-C5" /LENGTH=171 /DNA_ID=CAMNT_0011235463 /DNA_START=93 /DNA_END=611 /DNA_ORIENTATION=+